MTNTDGRAATALPMVVETRGGQAPETGAKMEWSVDGNKAQQQQTVCDVRQGGEGGTACRGDYKHCERLLEERGSGGGGGGGEGGGLKRADGDNFKEDCSHAKLQQALPAEDKSQRGCAYVKDNNYQ